MSEHLFAATLAQMPSETVVVPFFRGESLTHPLFPEFMAKLSRFKTVQLASNGDYLTTLNQAAILTGCTFFSLSLHNMLMPWHLEASKFLDIARDRGLETQVSIIDSQVKPKLKKRFIREWLKHADRVRIYVEHSQNGFGNMPDEQPIEPCHKPIEDMVVYWDGKVGLCNHDWNNETWLGNLKQDSVETVWGSLTYQGIRELHERGKRRMVPSCKSCSFNNHMVGELYEQKEEAA